ncbi:MULTISPECIES: toxin-antitoxin system HicB family antitoxin [unclassified Rhizobium]|uniref:toxin-antitoxin system HicB family antitoxin n=1 Tax=unclassified Rhizobium TaxID=2613769 RepID=UPI0016107F7D|nr:MULTISPECIES: toxin-antitoxin system HicB family antitoxin [unclassified Rhizobium]MBB3384993.1 plasmid stability protein [Rhizobium sp. BK098]MBB3616430.1 plasmid stability protein [Rhizobium sp. BK609]MBB3682089.1 plasmid stability protein [Rhizobium sp. BK612]
MSTLTIRLPSDQHERLKALAASRGTSLNKLFEELTTKALTEFDAETRFRLRAAKGDKTRGIEILEKLDQAHSERG